MNNYLIAALKKRDQANTCKLTEALFIIGGIAMIAFTFFSLYSIIVGM